MKQWHDDFGHIDPAAREHLEKSGLVVVTDTTAAFEMHCTVCKECKSEAHSYGCAGRSPKAPSQVEHTDVEGPFHADDTGMTYLQVFVDEASRRKHAVGLKTRDAAPGATEVYADVNVVERGASNASA